MTVAEKVELLQSLFKRSSNQDVLTWGPTDRGFRWTCKTHDVAVRLAESLTQAVKNLNLDPSSFPYRFESDDGAVLLIEPIAD